MPDSTKNPLNTGELNPGAVVPNREWLKNVKDLPTLPAIAFQVLELMDNPSASAAQMGRIISADQGLTMRVLQVANSAFFGFPRRIGTINLAVVVLGFDTLMSLVVSLCLNDSMSRWKRKITFDYVEYWKHCVFTGIAARMLARQSGYRIPGEAFVSGVIHDIGKVILSRYFPGHFEQILKRAQSDNQPLHRVERELIRTNHGEIGGWLADLWNLPVHIVEAVTYHHQPEKAKGYPALTALLNLSDWLTLRENLGWSGETAREKMSEFAWNTLRLRRLKGGIPDKEYYIGLFDQEVEKSKSFVEMLMLGDSVDETREK